jgi:hypothetical protein
VFETDFTAYLKTFLPDGLRCRRELDTAGALVAAAAAAAAAAVGLLQLDCVAPHCREAEILESRHYKSVW